MLTIADVLQMPALRVADPVVLAGTEHLDRRVRWVHTTELPDIGPLLRGGDLLLTTGIALPGRPEALAGFASSLVASDAAGVVLELGRRWSSAPEELVGACRAAGLPLVVLRREVRFAAVAQAVGERLVDEQLAELRAAHRVHETFTELSISEAGPEAILDAVERLSGATVVLEDGGHRILDLRAGPGDVPTFVDDWERRSRGARTAGRTTWDESNGWLVTRIGRPERGWGRLVIGAPESPTERLTAVAERAAAALAMHRLHDGTRDGHRRRVHHELLVALLSGPGDADLHRRVGIAGVPVDQRRYVGLALRPEAGALDEVVAACLRAGELVGIPTLAAAFDSEVRALLAVPTRADPVRHGDRWAAEVLARHAGVVAAGSAVGGLGSSDRTLMEASQVLAAVEVGTTRAEGVQRLEDVRLRGLLTLLGDDERVTAFADRELAGLDDEPELLRTLAGFLEHGGHKSGAAAALNISRSVLYDRIARVETLLQVDLGQAESRTSLHVALLARRR